MENHMQVSEPNAKYMVKAAEYKQTEAGHIPADWRLGRLADVAQIRSGITKNSKAAIDNPVSVHYLRVANVQDGYLDLSDMSQLLVSQSDIKRHEVLPGDMLMNEGGDLDKLGRGALWRGKFSPCIHQNHVFVVRSGSQLIPEFLQAWTGSAGAKNYFMLAGRQTTNLASINKTALGQLPIPLPALEEQQAIATALSDTDALIDALEQLLAKKRQVKQGAMRELLTGKRRLEGFNGKWQQKTIGDLVQSLDAGVSVNATENKTPTSTEPCILKTSAAFNGRFIPEEAKPIIPQDIRRAKLSPRRDTLIISRMNTPDLIGECGYVDKDYPNLFIPDRLWMTRFRPEAEVCAQWLGYLLSTNEYKIRIKSAATGTSDSMKNLSKDALMSIQINAPRKIEQTAIAAILSDMDTDITDLETRLGKVRQVKQGMMRELLTGRTRLV